MRSSRLFAGFTSERGRARGGAAADFQCCGAIGSSRAAGSTGRWNKPPPDRSARYKRLKFHNREGRRSREGQIVIPTDVGATLCTAVSPGPWSPPLSSQEDIDRLLFLAAPRVVVPTARSLTTAHQKPLFLPTCHPTSSGKAAKDTPMKAPIAPLFSASVTTRSAAFCDTRDEVVGPSASRALKWNQPYHVSDFDSASAHHDVVIRLTRQRLWGAA